ncbi:MAG: DUF3750 domain-containing protein [bacterium]
MSDPDFERLLEKDKYQVFLFACPAGMPASFATHPWFVVNRTGTISRYGISWRTAAQGDRPPFARHTCGKCVGHLHKDALPSAVGIEMFFFIRGWMWESRLLGSVTGGEGSLAARMADVIERSLETYPYIERYSLIGPNSNTYPQWVVNQFPESGLRLPWNAFGKRYVMSRTSVNS